MGRLALIIAPLAIFIALIAVFATMIDRDPGVLPSVLVDQPAPEFSLPPVEGLQVPGFDRATLIGQVSVVNVFASWCIPCRDEHPFLTELKASTGVPIFGINQKDAPENARAFLAELGNPYDAVGADDNGRVSIDWGVYGVPETFITDAKGTIILKHIGPIGAAALEEKIIPAIEAARTGN